MPPVLASPDFHLNIEGASVRFPPYGFDGAGRVEHLGITVFIEKYLGPLKMGHGQDRTVFEDDAFWRKERPHGKAPLNAVRGHHEGEARFASRETAGEVLEDGIERVRPRVMPDERIFCAGDLSLGSPDLENENVKRLKGACGRFPYGDTMDSPPVRIVKVALEIEEVFSVRGPADDRRIDNDEIVGPGLCPRRRRIDNISGFGARAGRKQRCRRPLEISRNEIFEVLAGDDPDLLHLLDAVTFPQALAR